MLVLYLTAYSISIVFIEHRLLLSRIMLTLPRSRRRIDFAQNVKSVLVHSVNRCAGQLGGRWKKQRFVGVCEMVLEEAEVQGRSQPTIGSA